ncbi:MAG TPA: DHHA1 domain-containing protein [Gemmatimonadales bacterium]|nr:DHHA1 domain-containing protein [Gemmatimonadales bacterium]
MTLRLYYTDAYLREFTARVIGRDGTRVYLDRTAFYPTSGGQPHDLGTLNGVEVLDVIDDDDRIAHLLQAPLEEDAVEGVIDWHRRYDLMQQHTAQHLLTAVIAKLSGRATVSVHFGDTSSTLDLDGAPLSADEIHHFELAANQEITANLAVAVSFEDAATATGLRKASDRSGQLRIVTITELDRSACGGTHVRQTGELGALLLRKVEKVKQLTRVEFLAGARAIRAARADYDRLNGIAVQASTALEEVPALFDRLRGDLKSADASRRVLEAELNRYRAGELYHAATEGTDGIRVILAGGTSVDALRGLAQAVCAQPKALFVGTLTAPPTIVVASSADSGLDANQLLKQRLNDAGGRGGGNVRLAQGTVPSAEAMEQIVRQVTTR